MENNQSHLYLVCQGCRAEFESAFHLLDHVKADCRSALYQDFNAILDKKQAQEAEMMERVANYDVPDTMSEYIRAGSNRVPAQEAVRATAPEDWVHPVQTLFEKLPLAEVLENGRFDKKKTGKGFKPGTQKSISRGSAPEIIFSASSSQEPSDVFKVVTEQLTSSFTFGATETVAIARQTLSASTLKSGSTLPQVGAPESDLKIYILEIEWKSSQPSEDETSSVISKLPKQIHQVHSGRTYGLAGMLALAQPTREPISLALEDGEWKPTQLENLLAQSECSPQPVLLVYLKKKEEEYVAVFDDGQNNDGGSLQMIFEGNASKELSSKIGESPESGSIFTRRRWSKRREEPLNQGTFLSVEDRSRSASSPPSHHEFCYSPDYQAISQIQDSRANQQPRTIRYRSKQLDSIPQAYTSSQKNIVWTCKYCKKPNLRPLDEDKNPDLKCEQCRKSFDASNEEHRRNVSEESFMQILSSFQTSQHKNPRDKTMPTTVNSSTGRNTFPVQADGEAAAADKKDIAEPDLALDDRFQQEKEATDSQVDEELVCADCGAPLSDGTCKQCAARKSRIGSSTSHSIRKVLLSNPPKNPSLQSSKELSQEEVSISMSKQRRQLEKQSGHQTCCWRTFKGGKTKTKKSKAKKEKEERKDPNYTDYQF